MRRMHASYNSLARYYDVEYRAKDDDIDFYLDAARKYGSPILEIGIGTGRMAIPLVKRGHCITGIDNSIEMLKVLKSKLEKSPVKAQYNIQYILADMRQFSLNRRFTLCIIPFRAFLHNLSMRDQLLTLHQIHRHLEQGGKLVLDIFVPIYSVIASKKWQDTVEYPASPKSQKSITVTSEITHDPVHQILTIKNDYRATLQKKSPPVARGGYVYRYIFRYEMELLLRCAGFQLLDIYGDFEGSPYSFDSGNMVVVAEKSSYK
jgi:ubiquinone/menaquinone biosynthesis C-methylase UbiE